MRRVYILDGKEIDSSGVSGIIHKATKDLGSCACVVKDCKIKARDYYVIYLGYLYDNRFKLDCLFPDHESCIFGVSIKKRKVNDLGIVTKTFVICKRLVYDFKAMSYHYQMGGATGKI